MTITRERESDYSGWEIGGRGDSCTGERSDERIRDIYREYAGSGIIIEGRELALAFFLVFLYFYDKIQEKGGEFMEYLNGQAVPKDCTIDELRMMLESLDMQTFALACEALKNMQTTEAYYILKSKLQVKDKYRYRYILSVIFAFDESVELQDCFINAMQSDEKIFVSTALNHLNHRNLWVTDEQILSCFEQNHNYLDCYYYQILLQIAKTELHASRIIKLLKDSKTDSIRIAVAECLTKFATKENYVKIYRLLADSSIPKMRLEACRIACKFNRDDLLQGFAKDSDGHIRKYVNQALKANKT